MRGAQLRTVTGGQAARFTDGQDDQGLTCGRGQDDHEPHYGDGQDDQGVA